MNEQSDSRLFTDKAAKCEEIVQRFEMAWANGQEPAIEDYLANVGDKDRLAILEFRGQCI